MTTLEEERRKGKIVNLVTDDPKYDRGGKHHKTAGSYSNFRVSKVQRVNPICSVMLT